MIHPRRKATLYLLAAATPLLLAIVWLARSAVLPLTPSPSHPLTPSSPVFTDVTDAAGIRFRHAHGGESPFTILEVMGSGAAWLDYDRDGWIDFFIVNSGASRWHLRRDGALNALYHNNRDGTFTDVTRQAKLEGSGYGMGCCAGDYDNDGDVDLYVTNYGPNLLYRNNGDGTFTDVTRRAGVGDPRWSSSVAFVDTDQDGDLDLYVVNYVKFTLKGLKWCNVEGVKTGCAVLYYDGEPDTLYRNNGNGTFTDVTRAAGVFEPTGRGLGVVCGDIDNDGDQDLYVANDETPNRLYRNDGKGRFTDVTLRSATGYNEEGQVQGGMGTDFGDADNDGFLDLFVANFQHEYNILYHNNGDGTFRDVSAATGLVEPSLLRVGFGAAFFDADNDGDQDLFVANGHVQDNVAAFDRTATYAQGNQLFENQGAGSYREVSAPAGLERLPKRVGRGAAFGDYDNDGDLDVLVVNSNDRATLLRNDGGNRNAWLTLNATGTRSNRDGIGARFRVVAGGRSQIDEVRSGSSYLSQNDFRVTFGLGAALRVDRVDARWPSGLVEQWRDVKPNQILTVVEGKGSD